MYLSGAHTWLSMQMKEFLDLSHNAYMLTIIQRLSQSLTLRSQLAPSRKLNPKRKLLMSPLSDFSNVLNIKGPKNYTKEDTEGYNSNKTIEKN